jgi:hypothetical protein
MKQKVIILVAVIFVVIVAVVTTTRHETGVKTAGMGINLSQANDTTISHTSASASINQTNEEGLAQIMLISNLTKEHNGLYVGYNMVGTVSTQFGVACPVLAFKAGADFDAFKLEAKVGQFGRNTITTTGFDPQFGNACVLLGESSTASKAAQISYIDKNTVISFGHQGGSNVHKFNDGNWYVCAQQGIKNVRVSAGVDFAEETKGFAAANWSDGKHHSVTVTGNNLGTDAKNCVLSYTCNRIPMKKSLLNFGSAFYFQKGKSGMRLVAGLTKGKMQFFTEAGGYLAQNVVKPTFGGGVNYNF